MAPSGVKPFRILFAAWGLAGLGAAVGSILGGKVMGDHGLFAGAVLGGLLGVAAAVGGCRRLGWLPPGTYWGAVIGGSVGFLIAAPIAVTFLHTPITPVMSGALTGVGVLVGTGMATGGASRS